MTAARAYIRVSTVAQSERGVSLDTQREMIERHAASVGLTIVAWYVDVMSGTREDRPQYRRMLAEMEAGDTLLFFRFDRLGRKNSEAFRLFEECKQRGIALVSVTEPSLSNEFARNIMMLVATQESEQTAARVRANLTRLAEMGRWVARVPHWYRIGEDGHLTPTEDAWQAQACWEMFLTTGNKQRTAAAYGLGTRQFWWMLNSPAYIGAVPWLDTVAENAHPAIVRRETWEAARALIEARKKGKRRERANPALLTGFIYVEDTGRRMQHKPMRSKNFAYRYYSTDHDHYYEAPRHVIRADIAEGAALDALRSLTITAAQRKEIERGLRDAARRDPHKRERTEIRRRIAALEAEQVNTARMAARGEIGRPTWEAMRREQANEMTALLARRDRLPALVEVATAAPLLDLRLGLAARIDAAWEAGNVTALRMLVEGYITRVEVWGAESPRLHGGAARRYWMEHVPDVRVEWRPEAVTDSE